MVKCLIFGKRKKEEKIMVTSSTGLRSFITESQTRRESDEDTKNQIQQITTKALIAAIAEEGYNPDEIDPHFIFAWKLAGLDKEYHGEGWGAQFFPRPKGYKARADSDGRTDVCIYIYVRPNGKTEMNKQSFRDLIVQLCNPYAWGKNDTTL